MLNRGLLYKSYRETRWSLLSFGLALLLFQCLLAFVLPSFAQQIGESLIKIPFMRSILTGMLGMDPGEGMTGDILSVFAWGHPVVLALIWTQEITFCTRIPAGEVDRGTFDMILAMPVSRMQVYLGETGLWLVCGLFLLAMAFLGNLAGFTLYDGNATYNYPRAFRILGNLFGLYLAVGGFAFLASAWSNHKNRAMTFVFSLVIGAFFLNFVARLWSPAGKLAWLSLMEYYQPMEIARGHAPWGDTAVLVSLGLIAWVAGAVIFRKKDIPTT